MTLFKGLKNLKLDLDLPEALLGSCVLGLVGAGLGMLLLRLVKEGEPSERHRFSQVERVFRFFFILKNIGIEFFHTLFDFVFERFFDPFRGELIDAWLVERIGF